jgi:drug/metabolite transporter (DMT)-like permease
VLTRLLIIGVAVNAVVGQLFLKRALATLGGKAAFADFPKFIFAAARSPWIYTSVAIQAVGYILWMIVITRVKLGVATALVGAGFYVLMAACAWFFYGESITYLQWFGIVFITIGVTCLSLGPT